MLYDAEAKRVANHVGAQRLQTLRGVMFTDDRQATIVFGNDDYSGDGRTRDLVSWLLKSAHDADAEVLGFAVNDAESERPGRAWALVLRCDDLDWAKARLFEAFFQSHPLELAKPSQNGKATTAQSSPDASSCLVTLAENDRA